MADGVLGECRDTPNRAVGPTAAPATMSTTTVNRASRKVLRTVDGLFLGVTLPSGVPRKVFGRLSVARGRGGQTRLSGVRRGPSSRPKARFARIALADGLQRIDGHPGLRRGPTVLILDRPSSERDVSTQQLPQPYSVDPIAGLEGTRLGCHQPVKDEPSRNDIAREVDLPRPVGRGARWRGWVPRVRCASLPSAGSGLPRPLCGAGRVRAGTARPRWSLPSRGWT